MGGRRESADRCPPAARLAALGVRAAGDLQYLLEQYEHIEYVHAANLAPTDAILDGVAQVEGLGRLPDAVRGADGRAEDAGGLHRLIAGHEYVALLCSEAKATTCHRGVLARAYAKAHHADVVDL